MVTKLGRSIVLAHDKWHVFESESELAFGGITRCFYSIYHCIFRTNTVVLVDATGHATYVERTLEDDATDPDEAEWRLSTHEFEIQEACGCHDENHNIPVVFNSSL